MSAASHMAVTTGGRPALRVVPLNGRLDDLPGRSTAALRRRRLVAGAVCAGLLVALALIARLLLVVPSPVTRAAPATPLLIGHATYVVQPGDTAWSIARSLHAAGDIRGVVDQLVALAGGRGLRVGQTLDLGRIQVDR